MNRNSLIALAAVLLVATGCSLFRKDDYKATQAKAAQPLVQKAKESGKSFKVMNLEVGHHQMTELPDATLFAIRDFLKT